MLREGLAICAEINFLPQWWSYRVGGHLIDDLWSSSFHERLPLLPDGGDDVRADSLVERAGFEPSVPLA
jgi:hypothetical protein